MVCCHVMEAMLPVHAAQNKNFPKITLCIGAECSRLTCVFLLLFETEALNARVAEACCA